MKTLATPDNRDILLYEHSRLIQTPRYTKKFFLTAVFVALISTATFADPEWTDYVVPGEQTGTQTPYQPLYPGAPGGNYTTPMCQKGKLRTDAAWYRLCICYNGPCFITYYSIASYACPDGKSLWVVTARGKTDKKCGKAAVTATSEIFKKFGEGYENPPGGGTDESFPSDSEVSRLIVDEGKHPDENSKKAEDKKETKEEKKETKTTTEGGGKTDKRPRKHVTKKSGIHARRDTETSPTGGGGISIGIGIGGFGGRGRGGEGRSSGDHGGAGN